MTTSHYYWMLQVRAQAKQSARPLALTMAIDDNGGDVREQKSLLFTGRYMGLGSKIFLSSSPIIIIIIYLFIVISMSMIIK